MSTPTNLDPSELQNLKELQQEQTTLISNFGQVEFQIQLLEIQKEKLIEDLEVIKGKETTLAESLEKKYGQGVINIEEGTLTKQ
jgi:hypothetical protein|tara:strand:+ start:1790 stop:2041 length:252 start_codon:yes stop_codon:yes gene_type:complete